MLGEVQKKEEARISPHGCTVVQFDLTRKLSNTIQRQQDWMVRMRVDGCAPNGRENIYLSAGCLPTTDDEECKWMLPMNEPRPKPTEMFR
ncbi:hypothetical protein ANTPLA_LOCUS7510 [Anthophora plagiata]